MLTPRDADSARNLYHLFGSDVALKIAQSRGDMPMMWRPSLAAMPMGSPVALAASAAGPSASTTAYFNPQALQAAVDGRMGRDQVDPFHYGGAGKERFVDDGFTGLQPAATYGLSVAPRPEEFIGTTVVGCLPRNGYELPTPRAPKPSLQVTGMNLAPVSEAHASRAANAGRINEIAANYAASLLTQAGYM